MTAELHPIRIPQLEEGICRALTGNGVKLSPGCRRDAAKNYTSLYGLPDAKPEHPAVSSLTLNAISGRFQ